MSDLDDLCPCEDGEREPCPEHLTRCCDGCLDRFEERLLADIERPNDAWSWCAACATTDVAEDWREADRARLATIGVWIPQDLTVPTAESWSMARGLRDAFARDLGVHTRLTFRGARVDLHTVAAWPRLVAEVENGAPRLHPALAGAMPHRAEAAE